MLTDLRVSSWACQLGFYKPEHNTKGGPHGMEYRKNGM